jgi:hypothetical protein
MRFILRWSLPQAGETPGHDPELLVVEVAPKRPKRTRKVAVDEPDLIWAR